MQQFTIQSNEAGQRLDKFLHKYLKEAPGSFLYKMLRKKNITLNGKKAEGKEILAQGDRVCFFFSEETFAKFRGEDTNVPSDSLTAEYRKAYRQLRGIEVIFENDHILLANKPAGCLTQKAKPGDLSLNEWLIGYLLSEEKLTPAQLETFHPSVVNRLDRNTSGLVICGKSLAGSRKMSELIKERDIHKFYHTFVKGRMTEESRISGYLKKDERINTVTVLPYFPGTDREYDAIETGYKPLKVYDEYTYLEVELITGKPHQIRAHLASIGHPLLGDNKYGDRAFNRRLDLEKTGQLLHACRLEMPVLEEPFADISGKIFTADEPAVFAQLR
jgi:23S rRNA pseudouridine955/2504/2580 synthase